MNRSWNIILQILNELNISDSFDEQLRLKSTIDSKQVGSNRIFK